MEKPTSETFLRTYSRTCISSAAVIDTLSFYNLFNHVNFRIINQIKPISVSGTHWPGLKKIGLSWEYEDGSQPEYDFWASEPTEPSGDGPCVAIWLDGAVLRKNDIPCSENYDVMCEYII